MCCLTARIVWNTLGRFQFTVSSAWSHTRPVQMQQDKFDASWSPIVNPTLRGRVTQPREVEIFVRRRPEPDPELEPPARPSRATCAGPAPQPVENIPTPSAGGVGGFQPQHLKSHRDYRNQPFREEAREPGGQQDIWLIVCSAWEITPITWLEILSSIPDNSDRV